MNGWGRLVQSASSANGAPIGEPSATFGWWQDNKMHGNSQTFTGKHFHVRIDSGWYVDGQMCGPHKLDHPEFRYLDFNEETADVADGKKKK